MKNCMDPPIHLLHSINQYCVMKKRNQFPMNEINLEFNKIFFLVSRKLKIPEMLFDSLDVYL